MEFVFTTKGFLLRGSDVDGEIPVINLVPEGSEDLVGIPAELEPNEEIIGRLTGKAAAYFADTIRTIVEA